MDGFGVAGGTVVAPIDDPVAPMIDLDLGFRVFTKNIFLMIEEEDEQCFIKLKGLATTVYHYLRS